MKKKPDGKDTQTMTAAGNGKPDTDIDGRGVETGPAESGAGAPATDRQPSLKSDAEPRLVESTSPGPVEEKLAALNEKYLRLLAEYDNFRKRTAREMEFMMDIVTEKLLSQFLPILDNLDRATEHRNDRTTLEEYVKGIAIIEDQLRQVLAHAGLGEMEVIGQKFDPAVHSAVFQQELKDHEPGTIIAEVEKGYTLQGKIIRHPKVVVSTQ